MLGRLHNPGVVAGVDGEPVGAADPGLPQVVDRLRHDLGVLLHVGPDGDGMVRALLGDAEDAGRGVAVEHRRVLGQRDLAHRLVELRQVDVAGPAVRVVELLARDRKVRSELDQRERPGAAARATPSPGLATSSTRPRSVAE